MKEPSAFSVSAPWVGPTTKTAPSGPRPTAVSLPSTPATSTLSVPPASRLYASGLAKGTGVAGGTGRSPENSEVLPPGSVAVAEMTRPAIGVGEAKVNAPVLPAASVVTVTKPR